MEVHRWKEIPNITVGKGINSEVLKSHQQSVILLKERLNAYFNRTTQIDYLDEAREIAFFIQELHYKNRSLTKIFSKGFKVEHEYTNLCKEIETFEEEYRIVENALQCLVKA